MFYSKYLQKYRDNTVVHNRKVLSHPKGSLYLGPHTSKQNSMHFPVSYTLGKSPATLIGDGLVHGLEVSQPYIGRVRIFRLPSQ